MSFEKNQGEIKEEVSNRNQLNPGIDSEIIHSILRQKLLSQLLLIDNVLAKIHERKISHAGLIKEIITIEDLIMLQIKIFNHKFGYGFRIPENLKAALEHELFVTKRERIKIEENTMRDVAQLEVELRRSWKEVFDLLTKMNSI